MSETKFTKGPWSINKYGVLVAPSGQQVIEWDSGIAFGSRTAETEANAALRNAAPELYEALEGVLRIVQAMRYVAGLGNSQLDRVEKARAALAKARGEA